MRKTISLWCWGGKWSARAADPQRILPPKHRAGRTGSDELNTNEIKQQNDSARWRLTSAHAAEPAGTSPPKQRGGRARDRGGGGGSIPHSRTAMPSLLDGTRNLDL